nr:reverse transcriptase domain-containing protein [Tanacetum cinerariifolium]
MSEKDVKNMLEIIPVSEFKIEALQVKYPLIDWEIHFEGSRSYWKIIGVGGITQAYQSFEDMLKDFDREYLDASVIPIPLSIEDLPFNATPPFTTEEKEGFFCFVRLRFHRVHGMPDEELREFCDKHYNQLLPLMAEKVHLEKLQVVQSRLTYEGKKGRQETLSKVMSLSLVKDREKSKENGMRLTKQIAPTEGTYLYESEHDQGKHWKSKAKKQRSTNEEDLSQPWLCEETYTFTAWIRNFEVPKRTHMPKNVKMYDGTEDPEDHLKIFQTAAKIERWVMPTWCHMFNSTLIGSAKVWFNKLSLESIDIYVVLRKAFLMNFSQQKKYIKDPVEIHHIKQKEGESMEAFMIRFKVESMHVSRALECMRIFRFMHGITNLDLIKRLNDNILKSVDEGSSKGEYAKSAKKGETSGKEKATEIFMCSLLCLVESRVFVLSESGT